MLLAERLWSMQALAAAGQQLLQATQTASISGDRAWIDRYDRLVNELNQAVEHAGLLAPDSASQNRWSRPRNASSKAWPNR